MRIILDCDGVLADAMGKVIKLYNNEYRLNYTLEDITDYNLEEVQAEGTDLNKYFNRGSFFKDLGVVEGAEYYLKKLKDRGHDLIVATISPVNGVLDKFKWIRENLPMIGDINFIVRDLTIEDIEKIKRESKQLNNNNFKKTKMDIYGDIIVDDFGGNLEGSKCRYKILFDRPWNRKDTRFTRVNDWRELYLFVTKHEK